ncbi:MAG: T9SS type A sorting domain-containing protein [Bacteroidota bacterium]|nr:T9SS type A sorting domain-containing protein [Bacteroidota bacterium]
MNRVVTLLVFLVAVSAYGQSFDPATFTVSGIAMPDNNVSLLPGDPCLPNAGGTTVRESMPGAFLAVDTLDDHFKRSTQFRNYTYRDANNNVYPAVGANTLYLFAGQKFPMQGTANVLGALLGVSWVHVAGEPDTSVVNVWAANETNGLPTGQTLGFGRFLLDEVDTSTSRQIFTYIPMEQPQVTVTNAFVLTVRTRRLSDNDDGFMIWSNNQGDGRGEQRACYITVQNNQLVAGNFATLLNFSGAPADFDIMILAVIDGNVTATGKPGPVIGGLEFRGLSPNPAQGASVIHLRTERETRVSLDVIDAAGRVTGVRIERELTPGSHDIRFPLGMLAPGSYFLRITHTGGSFATPLHVVR